MLHEPTHSTIVAVVLPVPSASPQPTLSAAVDMPKGEDLLELR